MAEDASAGPAVHGLVDQLIQAHEDGLRLTRRLLIAQATADETESAAAIAFDRAAARPWDAAVAECAIAAAIASEEAGKRDLEVAAQWSRHRERIRSLLDQARTLL
jgi:hypothetical protein